MEPVIILVQPQLDQNIGKVCRAMLNFGLTHLRLVDPLTEWLTPQARALAAGADQILTEAKVYKTLEEAIADRHFVWATSARPRDMIKEVCSPVEAARETHGLIQAAQRVGFVFGPERTGLTNEHLAKCHKIITVPLNPAFSSLNLAQAVVLVAYELYQALETSCSPKSDTSFATREAIEGMVGHLDHELEEAGYYRTDHKRPLMRQNLYNILTRIPLTDQEVRTLRGVISTLVNPHGIKSRLTKRRLNHLKDFS